MKMLVSVMSIATAAVSGWMCFMYVVLRHAGYQWRAAMAAVICLGAMSLSAGRPPAALRVPVGVWGLALAILGVSALVSTGDEGWAIIAGALFIIEGTLAVVSTVRRPLSA